jgi:hypothetical protein
MDISRAKSQFAFALLNEKTVRKFPEEAFHDRGGSVGGIILNYEDMKLFIQAKNIANDLLYVFFFIVRWNDDQAVGHKRRVLV